MYSKQIKNYNAIRDRVRDFYVYGFNVREKCGKKGKKNVRAYDDERCGIEDCLGECMQFRRDAERKNVLISTDDRKVERNPLYETFKTKKFSDKDIAVHFILFDILRSSETGLSFAEIIEEMREYLSRFGKPIEFNDSDLRQKLSEYEEIGLIVVRRQGKKTLYFRAESFPVAPYAAAIEFFSETALCGVIGSFILDKQERAPACFSFTHRHIMQATDSEVLCAALVAMSEKRTVSVRKYSAKSGEEHSWEAVPLKMYISALNGRQYLAAYNLRLKKIETYRLDRIKDLKVSSFYPSFDEKRANLSAMEEYMWGVNFGRNRNGIEHVEFTVQFGDNEEYIYRRMEREKRCGKVERVDKYVCRFTAEVFDTGEMLPWIRTFIGRIVSLNFSNRTAENKIRQELTATCRLYGLEE